MSNEQQPTKKISFDDLDTSYLEDHLDYDQRKAIFDGIEVKDEETVKTVFNAIWHHYLEHYRIEQVLKGYKSISVVNAFGDIDFDDTELGKKAQRESWKESKCMFAEELGISAKRLQAMIDAECK